MTELLYVWDASHYDGLLSRSDLDLARREGISVFTHKLGEGTSDTEGVYDDTALAAARDAGIPFPGGYYVVRSGAVAPQVDRLLALAEQGEPWWHTHPGWFWQVDLERWPYDSVSAATGIAFGQLLRQRTGRAVIMYASRGQYGNSLTAWDGPLWNANYPSVRQAPFKDLYPGNDGQGWVAYSGKTPALWQYSSGATIAGKTTCDISAFKGSIADFATLINAGGIMSGEADKAFSAPYTGSEPWISGSSWMAKAVETPLRNLAADVRAARLAIEALATAINAGGGSVDSAAVIAHMDELAAAELARDSAEHDAEVARLRAQLTALGATPA